MKTLKIQKHNDGFFKSYTIQRKSIFGFWYNFGQTNRSISLSYEKLKEARKDYTKALKPGKSTVICTNES